MLDDVLGATSPPLERRSPMAAGLSGVCLGPLGTVWSLGSWDALVTLPVYVGATILWGEGGMLLGLVFSGLYGAVRVARDNARLEAAERAEARRAAEAMRSEAPPMGRSRGLTYPVPARRVEPWPVVIELEAAEVIPPAAPSVVPAELPPEVESLSAPALPELAEPVPALEDPAPVVAVEPAARETLPEPAAPAEMPASEAAAKVEPPPPPTPPKAPAKRGRPKGSKTRKLAA